MPEFFLKNGQWKVIDILTDTSLTDSKNEARRLIQSGAVKVDENKILDVESVLVLDVNGKVFKVGKRRFARIFGKK